MANVRSTHTVEAVPWAVHTLPEEHDVRDAGRRCKPTPMRWLFQLIQSVVVPAVRYRQTRSRVYTLLEEQQGVRNRDSSTSIHVLRVSPPSSIQL